MKRSLQEQNITLIRSKLTADINWYCWEIEQLISANSWYNTLLWLVSKSQTVLWLAWWTFNRWITKVETHKQTHKQIDSLLNCLLSQLKYIEHKNILQVGKLPKVVLVLVVVCDNPLMGRNLQRKANLKRQNKWHGTSLKTMISWSCYVSPPSPSS